MGPRLDSFSPVDRNSIIIGNSIKAGKWRRLGPDQIKDHIFLILKVKETFPSSHVQKVSLEVKMGASLHSTSCQPIHRSLLGNPS